MTGYSVKLYLNTSLKPKMDLKELGEGSIYNLRKKSDVLRTSRIREQQRLGEQAGKGSKELPC